MFGGLCGVRAEDHQPAAGTQCSHRLAPAADGVEDEIEPRFVWRHGAGVLWPSLLAVQHAIAGSGVHGAIDRLGRRGGHRNAGIDGDRERDRHGGDSAAGADH